MQTEVTAARQRQAEDADRLANTSQNAIRQPNNGKDQLKAPKYDGSEDVEVVIRQFTDVVQANNWTPQVTYLNLGLSLDKEKEIWTIPAT